MDTRKTVGRIIAGLAVATLGACGKSGAPVDDGLARDLAAVKSSGLELAPRGGGSQVVVSAIEGGPSAAPARSTRAPASSAARHAAPVRRKAVPSVKAPVPAHQAAVATSAPVPAQRATSERAADPAPLPPASSTQNAARERQRGTYSTEAEIFRRMPWIRP
jgi:hypothetical protein